jgi:hypothetical protein
MVLLDEKRRTAEITDVNEVRAPRDKVFLVLVFVSIAVSIAAFAYFYAHAQTLMYKDAVSHLEIARRIVDSPSPGLTQVGGVWPPLTHLLSIILVWWDWAYFSGFAMTFWSMLAFVLTAGLLYKSTFFLTGSRTAGVVAGTVFMINPNVLYMQSTPMTELPLFAAMVGMAYGTQRWIQTDKWSYVLAAGLSAVAGSLIRYEAWVYLAVMFVIFGLAAWHKRYGPQKAEGLFWTAIYASSLGILFWMAYNQVVFHSFLNFWNGEYAKPSLWVGEAEKSVGNLPVAFKTYFYAVQDNLLLVGMVLAALGLIAMIVKERLSLRSLPSLGLMALFPFFVVALYTGQRPLHVLQIGGTDLYNVRFGLLMVLPEALMIGYLVSVLSGFKLRYARLGLAGALTLGLLATVTVPGFMAPTSKIVTLKEPLEFAKTSSFEQSDGVSTYLASHYTGGKILMESFGNELVLFRANIGLGDNVYEGSYKMWEPALDNPSDHQIKWIVMRHTSQPDLVYTDLHDSPELDSYTKVFSNDSYDVYEEK